MSRCRAPNCPETQTIKSHIIPQGFARWMRADQSEGGNLLVTPERISAKYPNGMFVTDILCAKHDAQLGRELDEPFFDLATSFAARNRGFGRFYYRIDDIDPVVIARWIVSVIWRSSVTSQRDWHHIDLGEFEWKAGEIAFGAPLDTLPGLSIEVGRYRQSFNGQPFEADKLVAMPWTKVIGSTRLWMMTVGGFRMSMKFGRLTASLGPLEVVGQTSLFGAMFDLENTVDHRKIMRVIEAADRRDAARGIER